MKKSAKADDFPDEFRLSMTLEFCRRQARLGLESKEALFEGAF